MEKDIQLLVRIEDCILDLGIDVQKPVLEDEREVISDKQLQLEGDALGVLEYSEHLCLFLHKLRLEHVQHLVIIVFDPPVLAIGKDLVVQILLRGPVLVQAEKGQFVILQPGQDAVHRLVLGVICTSCQRGIQYGQALIKQIQAVFVDMVTEARFGGSGRNRGSSVC